MMFFRILVVGLVTSLLMLQLAHLHDHAHQASDPHSHAVERCAPASSEVAAPEVEPIVEDTILVDVKRETIEQMLAEHERNWQVLMKPYRGSNGRRGVEIDAIRPGSAFELIGLHRGDILHAINDMSVAKPGYGRDSLGPVGLPDFLDLTVERAGSPIRILVLLHR